ncbi:MULTISPECIES: fumarylacetoacetate hydrolase family protein [Brevibacillus]|jgi:fumarylpyruvate hydrolase|uniref:Fumarylacetoacetate hydrolase n=1 Tax=Brevibacillus parabrevis TaxID=54914 RepID=A0A4Y3PCV6_BREPA|nr:MULTISPECIES: fumarylacetoacetate hydrolase family protein [Brevibacillus]MBU8712310.1 fumarylacetoacetate hydrolase family protein [Brevibacillus parabrevis]MDR5001393.1 fumarylacetoacetate hydrolase family protein [Brevibacillus parabrevis]MED2257350.1 fumarylacetoacetate hydrolase family protein [Brevibacillus parabrevis]NRQ52406.1 fumarylacetoacetate hydrolase family protein [Brevibacillus sp. HD1.4A]RNB96140.1 FAA hydrolase family protein [Brevibacillus parabrevis]
MEQIRNIYCVGRNYRLHAAELGNDVPKKPMIFAKPTHALAMTNGQEIALPGTRGELHYEAEIVVHIARPYEPGCALEQVIDKVALGIDFTLRDVQSELKSAGHPWLLAKGFKNSAILTPFQPFSGLSALQQADFSLHKNGEQVQRGNISDVIFDLETILAYVEEHFGLGAGDIIYTGTPAGVGPVADGDVLTLKWGDEERGQFTARLKG